VQATLLTLAIAAILALLAALLGPYFIDWDTHRATFEEQASQAIGMPVRVGGPMDVKLLPSPTLVLTDVEIGQRGDAQALRAKALGIEFALTPLLSGKLRAVEFRLLAPEIQVSLNAEGQAVLPNTLAGVNVQALSIDKFVVEDATLRFADAASGASAALTKLWFNGEVRALPGPIRGEGAFVMEGALYGYRLATGRPENGGSRIKLTVEPADRPVSVELEGLLSAEEGAPRFDGALALVRRVPVKGDKAAAADPWRVAARVKANAASALFEQVELEYGPEEGALKLHGTAEAKFGARPRIDAILTARALDADKLLGGDAAGSPRAALSALIGTAEAITPPRIDTQIGFGIDNLTLGGATLQNIRGDVEFGRGGIAVSGFEMRAPGFTQIQASGRLNKPAEPLSFAGPMSVTSTDPRAFAEWLEGAKGNSSLPARPVRFRGDVTLGNGKVAIERMQAAIDRKAFDGGLVYEFANGSALATLAATLRADELDLDAVLEAAGAAKNLAPLESFDDVSLSLSVKRLRLADLDAGSTDLRVSYKAGALAIDTVKIADFAGLTLDAKGKVDLKAQQGSVAFDLSMRDPQGLVALAKRVAAPVAEPLQRAAEFASPGKLSGTLTVEPNGRPEETRANLSLDGSLGALSVKLKTALSGRWNAPGEADLALDGVFDTGDVAALIRLAALDRVVSVPKQPGKLALTAKGRLDGDLALDASIAAANLEAAAKGNLRLLPADLRRAAFDVRVGRADIALPGSVSTTVPVAFAAQVKSDENGIRFDDIAATVAGSTLRGRLGLDFDEPRAIDGELRTDRIDAGALFAALAGVKVPVRPDGTKSANKDAAKKGGSNTDASWSETPFAPLALPKLSGRVSLSAAQAMLTPSLQVTKLRSALRFSGHDITVEDIEGEVIGGRLTGDVTLRPGTDTLAFSGQIGLADADATQLLFGEGAAPLTGQAALNLQFESVGRSPRALIGSLNGAGTLVLEHARIAAFDPKVFDAAMKSVDQGLAIDAPRVRDLASKGLGAGVLVVPRAEATVTLAAGVARIDGFTARAEAADLAVAGVYDLSNSRIDLRLAMSGPGAGMALKPEIALQLRGPAAAPERTIDVSALTGWLALRSVEQQAKKIEALEKARRAEPAPAAPFADDANDAKNDAPAAKPAEPSALQQRAPPQSAVQPLPPAIEIAPVPGERRHVLPQQRADPQRPEPPRAEPQRTEPPRVEPQRPGGANPFPTPIGSPPRAQQPPQGIRPIF